MTDKIESVVAPAVPSSSKKTPSPKTKKPRVAAKPNHPPASEMVLAAIKELKDKKGSSLQAIKKYIAATYKVDADKQAIFIRKYLKTAVANGGLIQTKGSGAAGSFKLPVGKPETKPKSTRSAAKPKSAPKTKKSASPKKAATSKAKRPVAEKKKATKVAAKPPKAKSTTTKPKLIAKAAPKKAKTASPKKKAPTGSKKIAAKKAVKK